MSRKSRDRVKKPKEAAPEEILAEGSGPVAEGAAVHVGIEVEAANDAADLAGAAEEVGRRRKRKAVAVEEDAVVSDDAADASPELSAMPPNDAGVEADATSDMVEAPPGDVADDVITGSGDVDDAVAAAEDVATETGDELAAAEAVEGDDVAVLPTSAASMDAAQLKHLVEALVFASDKPMTLQRLRQLTRVSEVRRLEEALASLADDYRERGIVLQQVSGGFQFRTRTQFSTWVQQLIAGRPVRLSRAQLETLAIVAYRQPITRPEIDEIRGVDSSGTLKVLMDRGLIRILGKREEVGRPMLYGTTKEFLDFFSLGDLRELPTLREYSELTDESRRVMSDRLGLDDESDPNDDPDDSGGSGGAGGSGGGGESFADGDDAASDDVQSTAETTLDELLASYAADAPAPAVSDGETANDVEVECAPSPEWAEGSGPIGDGDAVATDRDELTDEREMHAIVAADEQRAAEAAVESPTETQSS